MTQKVPANNNRSFQLQNNQFMATRNRKSNQIMTQKLPANNTRPFQLQNNQFMAHGLLANENLAF